MRRKLVLLLVLLTFRVADSGLVAEGQADPNQGYRPFLEEPSPRSIPFQIGETLVYEVNWKPLFLFPAFKAGEIRLTISEGREGRLQIEGWAKSEGTLSRVAGFDVKNYFLSEIDAESFRSYRSYQQMRQGSRQRTLELVFDYDRELTRIFETDPSSDPPRTIRRTTQKGIPGPAADVLSVFYIGRLRTFQPGDKYLIHLNERGEFNDVRVLVEYFEEAKCIVGTFPTVKVSTTGRFFRGGGDFRIWYSTDQLRVPVKFEADVKFGKIYGQLTQIDSGSVSKGTVKTR